MAVELNLAKTIERHERSCPYARLASAMIFAAVNDIRKPSSTEDYLSALALLYPSDQASEDRLRSWLDILQANTHEWRRMLDAHRLQWTRQRSKESARTCRVQ